MYPCIKDCFRIAVSIYICYGPMHPSQPMVSKSTLIHYFLPSVDISINYKTKAAKPRAAATAPLRAALSLVAAPVKEEGVAEAVEEPEPVPGEPAPG